MLRSRSRSRLRNSFKGLFGFPFYHALFPVYLLLLILSKNLYLFDPFDVLRPAIIAATFMACVFGCFLAVYRNSHKAALVTLAGFYLFAIYKPTAIFLSMPGSNSVTAVLLAFLFFAIALLAYRSQRIGPMISTILNVVSVVLLIFPVFAIAKLEWGDSGKSGPAPPRDAQRVSPIAARPNIVHVVLDGYSRSDVLQRLYGFDNSDFLQSLRTLGFTIAKDATTPYGQTIYAMSSIFSMHYINGRVSSLAKSKSGNDLRFALHRDLQNSLVLKSLRSMNYRIVSVESLYKGVSIDNADVIVPTSNMTSGISLFESVILGLTPIPKFTGAIPFVDGTYSQFEPQVLEHALATPRQPLFLYNHIVAPHPPFSITSSGRFRQDDYAISDGSHRESDSNQRYANYKAGYIEKLEFTNRAILKLVRYLKDRVPDPKIIVLHSDHGGGMYLDQENRLGTCARERFSSFLAAYSSDSGLTGAIGGLGNLVNLYRTIFTEAFQADYPPLPSHSYFTPWSDPQRFEELDEKALDRFGPSCPQANAAPAS